MTARNPQVTAVQDDVVDILQAQHQRIRDVFGRVGEASGVEKREMFEGLVRLLAVHEVAEEELVHPLARRKIGATQQVVDARLHEERQVKRSLAELYDLGTDHADFNVRLGQLGDAVFAHFEHEERDELPHLRQTVGADNLQRLASVVLMVERKAVPTRPHPDLPASTAVDLLLGPPLSVFDRVRDVLRDVRQYIEKIR
jgi:hypothetical protein